MIRLALPKGRNLEAALAAFGAAGVDLGAAALNSRQLRVPRPELGLELLLLKDWDLPLYVQHGVADLGIVGSDVLAEVDADLLMPLALAAGRCRLSLIGRPDTHLAPGGPLLPGAHIRLATKYPRAAARLVAARPWSAEILPLSGSLELAPLLDLAELALDIVQTGRTLAENGLVEIETVAEVAPVVILNRASYQRRRRELNALFDRLEAARVVL